MSVRILSGHVLDRLNDIEPGSVQICVTSPPYYGLRSYGTEPQVWGGNPSHTHAWGQEGRSTQRIRNGAEGGLHSGRATDKLASNVVLNPTTGAFCECGAWCGELGQEPTLALYLDHLLMVFDGVRRVLRDDGTCFVNLGDSYAGGGGHFPDAPINQPEAAAARRAPSAQMSGARIKGKRISDGMKPKDLMLIPHRFAIAMQDAGWWVRNDLVWAKTACMPESVTDRATRSHEYIFHFAKSARYYYDAEAVKQPAIGASRVRRDVIGGNKHNGDTTKHSDGSTFVNAKSANQRTVWTIGPQPLRDEHYAAYPSEIPRRCILAGSKPGDTVLDPFLGSGTTGIVADQLGRDCIGIELGSDYVAMSERRIRKDCPMFIDVSVS